MRDLLTYIGIALIAVLTAAFAAPFLIDFDAYRGRIAEEISAASGAQVALNGPISLRILPIPRFSAENMQMSGDFGVFHAENAFFELSLPALIGGRLQFSQARLDDCEVIIETQMLRAHDALPAAQWDDLVLHRAKVIFLRGGEAVARLKNLELAAHAPSLAGPFSARGSLPFRGENLSFSLASDVLAKNRLPLKVSLTWPAEKGRLDLDGVLDLAAAPVFGGEAKAQGHAEPGPWQAQAALKVSLDGAEARDVAATLGEGALAGKISGGGQYEWRSGRISLDLAAPRIDADWAELFSAPLLAASESAAPLNLRLAAEAVNWRGADWSQVEFSRTTGAPAHLRARGPGASQLDFTAAPDGSGWSGKARFKAGDFPTFAAALPQAAPVGGANFHAVEFDGDFSVSTEEWRLTAAHLALDRARLTGDLRFRPEKPVRRAFLAARLTAPALDLDDAPDLGASLLGGADLDLSLEAQTVKLAQGGRKLGESGRIRAHFLRDGEAARLERLDLLNIGGADLSASGAWGADFSGLKGEARLKAADFTQLAQVLSRLFPGGATKFLAARAKLLSPAELAAKAGGEKNFDLNGTLGGTTIAASFAPRDDREFAAELDLSAPEGGVLLNQLGASLLTAPKLGPARLTARAQSMGDRAEGLDVAAAADLADLHGDFHGLANDFSSNPKVEGELALGGDAAKIIAAFSAAPSPLVPFRLFAHLQSGEGVVALRRFAGSWGDDGFSGELTLGAQGIGGALSCDHLFAPALAALVLGPPAPVKAGALWSSLSFAPVVFDPPATKLSVATEDLQPFGGKAHFDLTLGPGLLSLARGSLEIAGGILRGSFDLRREGGRASLSGEAETENIELKNPGFSAKAEGRLSFAAEGDSAAALVGSLAGNGAARARNLVVAAAADDAPDRALAAGETDAGPFDVGGVTKTLDGFLARDDFRLPEADFSARLAGGRLSFSREGADPVLEFSFDLSDASMALAVSTLAQKRPGGWIGPLPRAGVIWAGPWPAPTRRVNAADFVNAVAAHALEREQARIEGLKQQDRARLRALAPQ